MYELIKMERYLRVNLLGPDPRLMKIEFTGPRSHKGWETLLYNDLIQCSLACCCYSSHAYDSVAWNTVTKWVRVQYETIIQQDLKVLQACLIEANNIVLLAGCGVTKAFV